MEETPIILPYILDVDKKMGVRELTKDAEAPLFFLFLERELQHLLKETKSISEITIVAKVYYSAWVAPWKEGRGLIIDALGLFPQAVNYDELPDHSTFIDELRKASSAEEYLNTLRRHSLTFFTTKASRPFIISLISQKGLIDDLQRYIIQHKRESVCNALSLNPKLSWQQASAFIDLLKEAEADLERLNAVRKELNLLTNEWTTKQKEVVEETKREYLTRVEEMREKTNLDKLQVEYQSKISELEKRVGEGVKALLDEQERLQSEIQQLQRRKEEYLKTLDNLRRLKEALQKQLNQPQRRREEIFSELAGLIAKLESLKAELLRLEDSAEEQKGVESQLTATRERISQINVEINRVNEHINKLKSELSDEDEKRAKLQEDIINLGKQITDAEKAIRDLDALIVENRARQASIPHQIDDLKKRGHDEILKADRDFRLRFDEIRRRVDALQLEMASKVESERRKIDEIRRRTDEITEQIDRLIQRRVSFIQSFYEASIHIPKSLEIDSPTLMQIPLYLVCFHTPAERIYRLYSPIAVRHVRRMPWSKKVSLEIMMKNFDRTVKERLYEAMKQDSSFEEYLLNSSARLNLLSNKEFLSGAFRGLAQLRIRGWLSARDADDVATLLQGSTLTAEEKKYIQPKIWRQVLG